MIFCIGQCFCCIGWSKFQDFFKIYFVCMFFLFFYFFLFFSIWAIHLLYCGGPIFRIFLKVFLFFCIFAVGNTFPGFGGPNFRCFLN